MDNIDIQKLTDEIKKIGNLKDDEKFFECFLRAYNIPSASINRNKQMGFLNLKDGTKIGQQIYCQTTEVSNLYSQLNILKQYNLQNMKVRFVLISNSEEILAFDLITNDVLFTKRVDLYQYVDFFFPLIGREKYAIEHNVELNISVSEMFAQLYNECRISNNEANIEDINELMCRILFCCVLNSMGLLINNNDTLVSMADRYTNESGSDFSSFLDGIFTAMNTDSKSKEKSIYRNINFIDSRIYKNSISDINFTKKMRKLVLKIFSLDWKNVDQEILGSLIQSIIVPNDNKISGNFTSTSNIEKLIGPLFLNDLYDEYENNKSDSFYCKRMIEKIKNIKIFDPSCGCGNFLIVSYKELSKLIKILSASANYDEDIQMPIENFYGIEESQFSCAIAKMGLLFASLQSNKPSLSVLKSKIGILFGNTIVSGDATGMQWESVCTGSESTFIIGNPSYKGAHKRTEKQNANMEQVFSKYNDYKNLDYASCWFYLAAKYIQKYHGEFAFVTTNSLTQGEQVSLLWPKIFEHNVHIRFAYKSFKWRNNAKNLSGVTVVIIGLACNTNTKTCELYTETSVRKIDVISPYLIPGSLYVSKRKKPIGIDFPKMIKGNMPYDGGNLLMDEKTKKEIVGRDSRTLKYMRRIVGSDEFINGIKRWCFWIKDEEAEEALEIPIIKERVEKVKILRNNKKDDNAKRLGNYPYRFREMRETKTYSLVIPSVSSENRDYIPVGFVDKNTVVTNLAFVIYDCESWIFGVISSKMHNLWIRTVCGGLETRIRYSSELGYNTFPFPKTTNEQKQKISECVRKIIEVREENPGQTYAEMYNRSTMTENLKLAHHELDRVIESCYREKPFENDEERIEFLFDLYERLKK